ncbi:hypothetical protein GCM10023332_01700 [Luteimonas vadosa]|uniref:O-antigen polysaccharide polymerase Wzy n=2 Tax=Luteimonas vadosa TaxID=1165507 RepID=A0ABP9DS47_9GAMM
MQIDRRTGLGIVVIAVLCALVSAFTANPGLTLASLVLAPALVLMLWRPGEPPVLLYAMGYHWLQASILVFYANVIGQRLADLSYDSRLEAATWLTLAGVFAIAIGARMGMGPRYAPVAQASVSSIAGQLSLRRLFVACLLAIAGSTLLTRVAYVVPGLIQPILALSLLRWVMVYLFTFCVLNRRQGFGMLAVVFAIEVVVGFLGFFSDFKTVVIVMMLAALTSSSSLRDMRLKTVAALAAAVLFLGLTWTAIKSDYRAFLNQGTGQQVVLAPVSERVAKLGDLIGDMSPERYGDAVLTLVERITYVSYLGQVIETVPHHIEHENGRLWAEALARPFMPRLLFPDKAVIDDSERTSYYTGQPVAGAEEGASISLGYVAESYIDFGAPGMLAPLLLWGILLGLAYRVVVRGTRYPLLGYASATVLIGLGASVLEQSNLKMVSALVLGLGVLLAFQWLLGRRVLRWLAPARVPHQA